MKVKLLTPIAGVTFAFAAGDTADFDDAEAKRMIEAGIAKAVTQKSATKKASSKKAK